MIAALKLLLSDANTGANTRRQPGRLAIVTGSELIGGHEMQLVHLASEIAIDRPVVVVVTSSAAEQFFAGKGFEVRRATFSRSGKIWRQWAAAPVLADALAPLISDCDAFLVSGGTIEACVAPARALKLLRPRAMITAYMPMYIDRSLQYGVIGTIYNCVSRAFVTSIDRFITCNRIQGRLIARHYRRPVTIFRNVITPIARPEIDRGPRLISVGRLDDGQKNVSGLIALLDRPENPFKTLEIFGDGPDHDAVKQQAASAGHIQVKLHGWASHDRLTAELGLRDVLIMNSRWEGEPLIVRELRAAGIPTIASNIAGFRGLISRRDRFGDQKELMTILSRLHAGFAARRSGADRTDR